MDNQSIPPEEPGKAELSLKEAYDIFASQINKEDALIASRMAWGLTSNGAALSVFGGLYAFLNSIYADVNPVSKGVILLLALVSLFLISFDVYYFSVESIWDARKQIYHIRQIYHQHWGHKLEGLHLPRPYGSRLPHGEHNYKEPEFFVFPTIIIRKWLPFAQLLHGMKVGRFEMVHAPLHKGSLRERRWYAEKILFAGLCTWLVLAILLIGGMVSEHLVRTNTQSPRVVPSVNSN